MRRLLFIHGTGVREESYNKTLEFVRGELLAELPQLALHPCFWGDLGASLRRGGASIPTYSTARAVGGGDESIAFWQLLYEDPFYELRYLAALPERIADLPPNVERPDEILRQKLNDLVLPTALGDLLGIYGLREFWPGCLDAVRDEPTTSETIGRDQEDTESARLAVARAVVALLLTKAPGDLQLMPGGEVRDRMADLVLNELGGRARSVGSWLGGQLAGLASSVSSSWIRRKRGKYSDASLPALGDILLYQTRGSDIRKRIRETILNVSRNPDGSDERIAILAHSLGGIACVDLFASEELPVSHLITCGSQAPLLYEIDSLSSRRFDDGLPAGFPRWLNIYDENDFLSYIGEGVFPGKVRDIRVESRQPFPQSHSAYWTNMKVWTAVGAFLAEA